MKLIIQIPCYNEEKTLKLCLNDLPRQIEGIDEIEILVVNDGSTDRTGDIARSLGVDHVISFSTNRGLARAFMAGIEKSLEERADIIVNTDADNQYRGEDIVNLVTPILEGKADIVVGSRQLDKISHFSWIKKMLNKYGSALVRKLSRTNVADTVSGFRAYSREAALRINIFSEFSYTLENLLQLGNQKLRILSVPVLVNPRLRESRLFHSNLQFVSSQFSTILRVYTTYKPLRVFTTLGILTVLPGIAGMIRFLYYYFNGQGRGHVQSLIFSLAFLVLGFLLLIFGLIADVIGNNRKLIENALYRLRKLELEFRKEKEKAIHPAKKTAKKN
ncbi:MAG: glycosyltransferase family 2 protein [Candidatus Aminicenantes bacterium]|nr:glycosyltransferase family 2 protein [Candidatus Aminicenantes bacterium]